MRKLGLGLSCTPEGCHSRVTCCSSCCLRYLSLSPWNTSFSGAKEISALSPMYQNNSLLCSALLLSVAKKVICSKLKLLHLVCKMSRNFLAYRSILKEHITPSAGPQHSSWLMEASQFELQPFLRIIWTWPLSKKMRKIIAICIFVVLLLYV